MLNRDLPAAQGEPPRVERMPARHALPPRSAAVGTPAAHDGALTHIRSVIAGLPESILLTDAHDRVELTNPAADALFDGRPVRDREDLLSRFETGGDPPATAERIGAADGTGTGPVQGPVTLRLRQQPNRWFSVESFPFERLDPDQALPAGEGSVHVLRDVTDTRDLRSEREAFLAIMSHELRTPITTIYAGSSVLARNPELSPPASHMLAVDISAEAARLYDLVEDLIVIARLERQVLDPLDEPVLLQRVLDVTARVLSNRAPDVPFERDGITDPPPVRGDATYIEQAARDLALAAARVGGPGRPVTLRLDHEDDSGEVVFSVLDRGPELSPAERGRVFDLPTETAIGRLAGIGVGPFVARQLVEAMGGRVWARNRHAGGVEMAFALPVDRG